MKFLETDIPGVIAVGSEPSKDERGSFARTFCHQEFEEQGLVTTFVQWSTSFNRQRGTIRGMHYQSEPYPETKLIRCTRGAIYDVVLDLRPDSPTYLGWTATELSDSAPQMLYVPVGVAHGFQALSDDTEVSYYISEPYRPESARGVRWDDPAFSIQWPLPVSTISERDCSYPDFASE